MDYIDPLGQAPSAFEPLPAGQHLVLVKEAAYKDNKKGTGRLVAVRFEVVGGPHKGKSVRSHYNIQFHDESANATALRIGRAEFAALCLCAGLHQRLPVTEMVDRLKFRTLQVVTAINGQYAEVKAHLSKDGAKAEDIFRQAKSAPAPAAQPVAAAAQTPDAPF